MYLTATECDHTTLRQGDILEDVFIFCAINRSNILYMAQPGTTSNDFWMYKERPETGLVMVLSQCCELDRTNVMKVTSVIVAPIRDINKASKPDKIQEIIETNIIDKSNPTKSFLKYFYVTSHPSVPFSDGAVVDFSKVYSYKNTSYDYLLQNKILQLSDEFREHMAFKLGLFFYRAQLSA